MPKIAFFHGWGFDASYWGPIGFGPNWETFLFDRGYFGEQVLHENLESVDLIVAHSWGLHWIPEHLLKSCVGIITINSFLKFIPKNQAETVKSDRVLSKMIKNFEQEPHEVLAQFYANVFHPNETKKQIPDFLHHALLMHDLVSMKERELHISDELKSKKWLVVQSSHDRILGNSKRNEWEQLTSHARLRVIENGTHALWNTHQNECIHTIRTWLKTVF